MRRAEQRLETRSTELEQVQGRLREVQAKMQRLTEELASDFNSALTAEEQRTQRTLLEQAREQKDQELELNRLKERAKVEHAELQALLTHNLLKTRDQLRAALSSEGMDANSHQERLATSEHDLDKAQRVRTCHGRGVWVATAAPSMPCSPVAAAVLHATGLGGRD